MENSRPTAQEVDKSEEILAKARANKKVIIWSLVVAAVCVVAVLVYILVAQAGSRKADELIAKADAAQNDSIALTLYAQAADAGYKSGNRAKAEMGIRLYRDGKYQEALEYLDDCSLDDEIAEAGVETLKGDCYVNLDQLDKAISAYKDAISDADENPEIVPFVLIKMANIYRSQGNYEAEAKAYKEIIDEYPSYVNSTRIDIRKFYERAVASK
ncbi:MAG: tetratricopeptide repeat protein [Muribaculaceae bacterium]|jgi:tetratricopeptide repeat protein